MQKALCKTVLIVERIPYAFDHFSDEEFSEKFPNQMKPLDQMRMLFQTAWDKQLDLDLQKSNVRIREDGRYRYISLDAIASARWMARLGVPSLIWLRHEKPLATIISSF